MRSKAQTKKKQEEMVFIPGTRRVPGIWDVVVVVVVVVFVVVVVVVVCVCSTPWICDLAAEHDLGHAGIKRHSCLSIRHVPWLSRELVHRELEHGRPIRNHGYQ